MNRRQYLGYGTGTLSLVMGGCGYVPEGDTVYVNLYGEEGETPADVALNPITVSESEFQLRGELVADGGKLNKELYRDVSILLYSGEGSVICSHRVGDWKGNRREVSFSTETIPTYVILYSPDFWQEPMVVDYFFYDSEREVFVSETASSRDELPVDETHTEAPSCNE